MLKLQTPVVPFLNLETTNYAETQDEYFTLPAYRYKDKHGSVLFRWRVPFWDRIKLLFTGNIYHVVMTFNKPLQPQKLMVNNLDDDELEYLHHIEATNKLQEKSLVSNA